MGQTNLIKKKVLAAGTLMIFGYGLVNNTLGFFVTPVSEALSCSRAAFNLYYSISCIVSLFTAPLFGQLLQKKNARGLILPGGIAGGLALAAFSLCTEIRMFYAVAFFLGLVQQGTTSVAAMVLVNRAYGERAGWATGIVMSGTGICSVSMSFVLPFFMERLGWQQAYLLEAALWLAVMAGAWVLTAGTVEYPIAEKGREKEKEEKAGTTLKEAVRHGALYVLFVSFAVHGMGTIVIQHIPSFLTELGKSAAESSMIMGVFSIILIVGKPCLGILFDRLGAVKTLLLNFVSLAVSMWLMIQGSIGCLWMGIFLMAFGMASITVLFPLVTGYVFGKKEYAAIWGVMSMAISCGTACGSPVWGAVYDFFGSYRPAFLVMPVVMLVNACVICQVMAHCDTKNKACQSCAMISNE